MVHGLVYVYRVPNVLDTQMRQWDRIYYTDAMVLIIVDACSKLLEHSTNRVL